jgi:NitT/TauT family transport system substrate-binding protein
MLATSSRRAGAAAAVLALGLALNQGAAAETSVKFTLDWVFQGPTSPFLLALDRGYYKAQGLDVSMDPGQGSAGAVQRVVTGAYHIGFADVNTLVEYNSKNPGKEVLCVFMAYDFPPFGVYALKSSGIAKPKDLEGKKLGAPVFDASFRLFPVFAKKTGVDRAKVTHVNLTPQLREQSLVQGRVDFISGHYFSSMLDLKARGVKSEDVVAMRYSDFGLDLYGNCVIVSPDMLQKEKEVRGFLSATIRAWKDVIADPKAGIAAAKKRDPLIDEALEMERLQLSLATNILTPYVKANGMGDVDPARFARSVQDVAEAFGLATAPPPDKVFTNRFLPPKAERMVTQ